MKPSLKLCASIVTLLVACLAQAAAPSMPVISVQQVTTDDPSGYATKLVKTNEVAKAKLGIENYIRTYVGQTGEHTGVTFSVTNADSVTTLTKNAAALEGDPVLTELREQLRAIRKLGPRTLYRAVHFEGGSKGASIYNTYAVVSDEAGYMKALDGLRALFDAHDLKDVKINAYRVLAGRTTFTHLVSLNTPSAERLAALLDSMGESWISGWLADVAKYRTVVSNATYRENTK